LFRIKFANPTGSRIFYYLQNDVGDSSYFCIDRYTNRPSRQPDIRPERQLGHSYARRISRFTKSVVHRINSIRHEHSEQRCYK